MSTENLTNGNGNTASNSPKAEVSGTSNRQTPTKRENISTPTKRENISTPTKTESISTPTKTESISTPAPQPFTPTQFFNNLKFPMFVSYICLPTVKHYAFYVVRIENYAAIVDTGVLTDASGEEVVELLMSSDQLLAGADEVEIFITHDHADHKGYTDAISGGLIACWLEEDKNYFEPDCEKWNRVVKNSNGDIIKRVRIIERDLNDPNWDILRNSGWERNDIPNNDIKNSKIFRVRPFYYFVRKSSEGRPFKTIIYIPPPNANENKESFAVEFEVETASSGHPYRCLLTGDMNFSEIMIVFSQSTFHHVDYLVQPHHGSQTYSSYKMFTAIPCDFISVPCGIWEEKCFFDDSVLQRKNFFDESSILQMRLLLAANNRHVEEENFGAFSDVIHCVWFNVDSEDVEEIQQELKLEDLKRESVGYVLDYFKERVLKFWKEGWKRRKRTIEHQSNSAEEQRIILSKQSEFKFIQDRHSNFHDWTYIVISGNLVVRKRPYVLVNTYVQHSIYLIL
ncbi:hypothetical protein PCE1_000515 [Barthelona sp. PCE]